MHHDPENRKSSQETVLVAEDHIDSRDALRTLLEAYGYAVLVAGNGREAVEVARVRHPDLILMDIMMPELDGFEAIRILRRDRETRAIPIIAVTAMEGARQLSLAAGANDFVPKPVDTRRLLDRIRILVGRSDPNVNGGGGTAGGRTRHTHDERHGRKPRPGQGLSG